ncbi:DNA-binding response OmpR family regulator [Sphingomonas zeicaulis]|uniref:response regulator n=1 Tax=Sphingomonas zeicaulis TaxID=1632740 RepID=UPI003D1ACFD9
MTDLPFAGKRVLIVEDEYYIACDLAHAFGEAGAEVVGPVSSLGQAVAVGAAPLDLAILDINLAGEMVYPLADQLLARSVPIAFATGYDASAIPARYANVPRFEKPGALKAIISRVASLGRGAA